MTDLFMKYIKEHHLERMLQITMLALMPIPASAHGEEIVLTVMFVVTSYLLQIAAIAVIRVGSRTKELTCFVMAISAALAYLYFWLAPTPSSPITDIFSFLLFPITSWCVMLFFVKRDKNSEH